MFVFFVLCVTLRVTTAGPLWSKYQHYLDLHSVDIFREYLRIDTSKEENIEVAIEFWIRQVTELGIPYKIHEPAGLPIFVATLKGSDPTLPSIMLNSHMDVVKADPSEWTYPPFDAYVDENGDIFARGTQDTKDVGIQYLEAIRKLKNQNITLTRNVHLTLTPDEESGGRRGMKAFVKTKEFKALNIGFALDEGLSSKDGNLYGTFVDRRPWQMEFVINGEGGHGFQMPDETAMVKTYRFMSAVMAFRDSQKRILDTKAAEDFTGYTSVNINVINGGLARNIIPSKVTAIVDMRLSPDADVTEIESIVMSWISATGNTTELTYIRKDIESGVTSVDDSNPYWVTMRDTLKDLGIQITPIVTPAASDVLAIRNLGIPAIGFTTKTHTISRAHAKDEYQNVETFLKGIDIYTELIKNLANIPCNEGN